MAKRKKKFYVNPKELHKELMAWKKSDVMSETLGQMLLDLVEGLALKKNFSGYTWLEEMKGKAIEFLLRYGKNYDPTKSNANAFAYCTTIARCAFIQSIQKENKQTEIRQKMYDDLVNQEGMLEVNGSPLENFRKRSENSRIQDDTILDLIEDYDIMVDILKRETRKSNG